MTKRLLAGIVIAITVQLIGACHKADAQNSAELAASQTAVLLSEFESRRSFMELFEYLHIDAKVLIPSDAIYGWYEENFFPRGPRPIQVTSVSFLDWTWEVNGVTYYDTAEVSFIQGFDDGSVDHEIVRLVELGGNWFWFFGRSLEFVNDQIGRHSFNNPVIPTEWARSSRIANVASPWGISSFVRTIDSAVEFGNALPAVLGNLKLENAQGETSTDLPLPDMFSEFVLWQYFPSIEAPGGSPPAAAAGYLRIRSEVESSAAVYEIAKLFLSSPYSHELVVYLRGDTPYAMVTAFANDAVGNITYFIWADSSSERVFIGSSQSATITSLMIAAMTSTVM